MTTDEIPGVVRRIDEELASLDWPEAEAAGNVAIGNGDCFVAAMGFEARALAGLRRACEGSRGFDVGLIRYSPELEQNQEEQFLAMGDAYGLQIQIFEYDRTSPAGMGQELANYVANFERAYIDISGMSRLLIVQTLAALVEARLNCIILYSEAEVYPPLREEFAEACDAEGPSPSFISSGIIEVASTPELSSVAMFGSPIRLIAFLSFDPSHLSNLVQEIQPTHTNLVRGRPPRAKMAWRTDAVAQMNRRMVRMLRGVETHETCTFDYRVTLNLVLKLYNKHSAFDRIVIAPTGSKMQALAIGIVRGVLSDLQIVYPTPRKFLEPDRYTQGVREVYWIPLSVEVR